MTNPYESPDDDQPLFVVRTRTRRAVLGVVLLTIALNGLIVWRNLPDLTIVDHLFGFVLWLALPLWAVSLVWRRRLAGRWILIALFGLRATVGLISLTMLLVQYANIAPLILLRLSTVSYFVYALATAWLLFSSNLKDLVGSDARLNRGADISQS